MKGLYSYEVYLRTRQGTVRRIVTLQERSVPKAKQTALFAVMRIAKGPVKVIDCVPLRATQKKAPAVKGRGRRQVTESKQAVKRTRRPKSRASAVITRKGSIKRETRKS